MNKSTCWTFRENVYKEEKYFFIKLEFVLEYCKNVLDNLIFSIVSLFLNYFLFTMEIVIAVLQEETIFEEPRLNKE